MSIMHYRRNIIVFGARVEGVCHEYVMKRNDTKQQQNTFPVLFELFSELVLPEQFSERIRTNSIHAHIHHLNSIC